MAEGQLDFFSILDSASEANNARPWCKSWLCARKNDCGVYVENVQTFRQGEGYRRYVELKCALDYPRVYYACSIQDRISGRGSPLDADGDYCFAMPTEAKNPNCGHTLKENI